jgi:1-aminocyclopropane-1-carboxylate deaminase
VIVSKPNLNNISLDQWDHPAFRKNQIQTDVLRLDKIHPLISGNKWFKLKYYIDRANKDNRKRLVSYGGSYSNHLLALAAAARINGFSSTGYIRGEKPTTLSPTLFLASQYGMELRFLSRLEYDHKKRSTTVHPLEDIERDTMSIPEGGASEDGIRGAEEILSVMPLRKYSHICCAVGTGTTLAGIVNSAGSDQKIIGVSVLKGTHELEPLNILNIKSLSSLNNVQINHEDHFGGYAKWNQVLIDFMNQVFDESGIQTDIVYTSKLFYSISRMAIKKSFPPGSRVLILHSGGLQGNQSLPAGRLQF